MRSKGLILALVLAVGAGAVWGLFSAWGTAIAEHVVGCRTRSAHLIMQSGGRPVIAETSEAGETTYRDLDGNPVNQSGEPLAHVWTSPLPAVAMTGNAGTWPERLRSFTDGGSPAVFWYFVADGGGHFVGYDSQTKRRVGYLGAAGFREYAPPADEAFPFAGQVTGAWPRVLCPQAAHGGTNHPSKVGIPKGPAGSLSGWDVVVLGADDRLYLADLRRRTVTRVKGLPPVRSVSLVFGQPDPVRGTSTHLAARTDDAVVVLGAGGEVLRRYPVPAELGGWLFRFVETDEGEGLMHRSNVLDPLAALSAREMKYSVYWVKPDGRSRSAEVTLPMGRGGFDMTFGGGVVLPSPVVLAATVATLGAAELREAGLEATPAEAAWIALRMYLPSLLIAQAIAAALAAVCYRRQVRYGSTGTDRVLWPLFVLALGLPGYVGYRFGRSWPALEACPTCDADVPRDRDACARCETEFPAPALRGTEVFA